MPALEIKGIVMDFKEVQEITPKFKKQELIVEYSINKDFIEYLTFIAFNKNIYLLEQLCIGDKIEIHFNLKGKYHEKSKNYFNSLVIWKIFLDGKQLYVQEENNPVDFINKKNKMEHKNEMGQINQQLDNRTYKKPDDFFVNNLDDDLPF